MALNISFCLLKLREFSRVNYGEYITINGAFSTNLFAHQTLIGYYYVLMSANVASVLTTAISKMQILIIIE